MVQGNEVSTSLEMSKEALKIVLKKVQEETNKMLK